jgi:cyclase
VLVTSIDREGTRRGFDVELVRAIADAVPVPVIASGGFGAPADLVDVVTVGGADGVAIADALHYRRHELPSIRDTARTARLPVREVA